MRLRWRVANIAKLLDSLPYEAMNYLNYKYGLVYTPLEDNGDVYFRDFFYDLKDSIEGALQRQYLRELERRERLLSYGAYIPRTSSRTLEG